MTDFTLTAAVLSGIAGAVLSLLFSYVPKLNTWFASQLAETKRLIMLGMLFIVAVAIFVLQCYGILDASLTCDKPGAISLVWILLSAIMVNQTVFNITPQTDAVKVAAVEPAKIEAAQLKADVKEADKPE